MKRREEKFHNLNPSKLDDDYFKVAVPKPKTPFPENTDLSRLQNLTDVTLKYLN